MDRRTMINNPNIPEEIRKVASDGTALRYALMEMSGADVIALGRGDPDLPTPQHIIEAAKKAVRDGAVPVSPVAGLPELRAAIAEKLRRENGLTDISAENVIVTTGGQEGLFLIMQVLLNPGDEV